jgi:hypothetical protein
MADTRACIHSCTYITYIYRCEYIYIYTSIHVHTDACILMYIYIYMCVCVSVCVCEMHLALQKSTRSVGIRAKAYTREEPSDMAKYPCPDSQQRHECVFASERCICAGNSLVCRVRLGRVHCPPSRRLRRLRLRERWDSASTAQNAKPIRRGRGGLCIARWIEYPGAFDIPRVFALGR